MVWSPGVQLQTSLVGTERVVIDNGAAVLTETTTAAIAALADSEPQKQNNALTTVGAGFNYAITDHLAVGFQVNAVQAHGGGYGGPVLQPGSAGIP